jgi:hypothetical protein
VLIQDFEELPPPEAIDRFSAEAMSRASDLQASKGRNVGGTLDNGINRTPEVVDALAQVEVRRYFDDLSSLVGQKVEPERLRPGWEAHPQFRASYPISGTRLFLGFLEARDSSQDRGIAEVQVLYKGMNFGSVGGPSLQFLGPVARIWYRGLLAESSQQRTTDH